MGDIGELLSKKHSDQKAENREVFLRVFQNLSWVPYKTRFGTERHPCMVKKCILAITNVF